MRRIRKFPIIAAVLVSDRRRQLNMLNGRSLPFRVQIAGVVLIILCIVLAGAVVFTVSTQVGRFAPLNSTTQPTFLLISWFVWVILLVALAGSIDPESARAVNEPTDAAVLSSFEVLRRHLIWSRLLIPMMARVLGMSLFSCLAFGPWLASSNAGVEMLPIVFAVLLSTIVGGNCIGMAATLLLTRWGKASTISVRHIIMTPILAMLLGTWLGPSVRQFSETRNIVESGYTVLAEIIASSRPDWWEDLFQTSPVAVTTYCIVLTGLSILLLGGVALSLLKGPESQAGFKVDDDQRASSHVSLAMSKMFKNIALRRSMAFRVLASVITKDVLACFRQDRLALRKAYLTFLGGLALLGSGIGAYLSLDGRAVLDAPLILSGTLITAFMVLAADGSVQISSIEAERNNWQMLCLMPLTTRHLRATKICSFAMVTIIISMPGVVGIVLLTSGQTSQMWILLAISTSISLLAGLSSVLTQVLSPLTEANSMRVIERSPVADLVQPILISSGAAVVISCVALMPSPALQGLVGLVPLALTVVFVVTLFFKNNREDVKVYV
ncbi:MAG: hypothetical protein RR861_04230 [Glutamicibacter sp.]